MDTEPAVTAPELIDIHKYVLGQLELTKGTWRAIADESGVPYDTITKIAQRQIEDPKVSKLQKLANYFRAKQTSEPAEKVA